MSFCQIRWGGLWSFPGTTGTCAPHGPSPHAGPGSPTPRRQPTPGPPGAALPTPVPRSPVSLCPDQRAGRGGRARDPTPSPTPAMNPRAGRARPCPCAPWSSWLCLLGASRHSLPPRLPRLQLPWGLPRIVGKDENFQRRPQRPLGRTAFRYRRGAGSGRRPPPPQAGQ